MSWYQIGKGYYGIALDGEKVSESDQQQAAATFRKVFKLPSRKVRMAPDDEPKKRSTAPAGKVAR